MTVSTNDFRKIEDGIRFVLASDYGNKYNEKLETKLNELRIYLKDRNLRIEGTDPLTVEPIYPQPIALVEKKNNAPVGRQKKAEVESETDVA
jgi:hypothetical protein